MNNIIAYFKDVKQAEKSLGAMCDHGVEKDHLSLTTSESNLEELYTTKAAQEAREKTKGVTTTTANDAATGALKGTGIGLGVGALGALASVFIPGYGLVFGSGALMTASLAAVGTGAGGGVAGAVTGYLKDQGLDESLVGEYKEALDNAGAVVGVEVVEDTVSPGKVKEILKKYEGRGITIASAVMSESIS
jgi:uncharacterized membrane protein